MLLRRACSRSPLAWCAFPAPGSRVAPRYNCRGAVAAVPVAINGSGASRATDPGERVWPRSVTWRSDRGGGLRFNSPSSVTSSGPSRHGDRLDDDRVRLQRDAMPAGGERRGDPQQAARPAGSFARLQHGDQGRGGVRAARPAARRRWRSAASPARRSPASGRTARRAGGTAHGRTEAAAARGGIPARRRRSPATSPLATSSACSPSSSQLTSPGVKPRTRRLASLWPQFRSAMRAVVDDADDEHRREHGHHHGHQDEVVVHRVADASRAWRIGSRRRPPRAAAERSIQRRLLILVDGERGAGDRAVLSPEAVKRARSRPSTRRPCRGSSEAPRLNCSFRSRTSSSFDCDVVTWRDAEHLAELAREQACGRQRDRAPLGIDEPVQPAVADSPVSTALALVAGTEPHRHRCGTVSTRSATAKCEVGDRGATRLAQQHR